MRVLLDTNVLIHREASTVVRGDIGNVFNWLDKLKHEKCAHPVSLAEIEKHKDEKVRKSFRGEAPVLQHPQDHRADVGRAAQFASHGQDGERPERHHHR